MNTPFVIQDKSQWTFFSNHTHVLVCIAEDPEIRTRDIAGRVGITERSAARIIQQLRSENILVAAKKGRRNQYFIDLDCQLRHQLEAHCTVGDILSVVIDESTIKALRERCKSGICALKLSA